MSAYATIKLAVLALFVCVFWLGIVPRLKRLVPRLKWVDTHDLRLVVLAKTHTMNLALLADILCEAAGMKKMGDARIDRIDSPLPNIPSRSLNQPLITSILSMDEWVEYDTLVVLLHSCQMFHIWRVAQAISKNLPKAQIIGVKFSGATYPVAYEQEAQHET